VPQISTCEVGVINGTVRAERNTPRTRSSRWEHIFTSDVYSLSSVPSTICALIDRGIEKSFDAMIFFLCPDSGIFNHGHGITMP
jgi:hypothetical protein